MPISGAIIYDGECAFCIKQVQRIQKFDKKAQFMYDIRQNKNITNLYPELKEYENVDGLRFCSKEHTAYIGADAVFQIYNKLSPFNLLAWTYKVPGLNLIFKAIYAWIAKNRYKFSEKCKDEVCEIPYNDRKS
jgi:predicted DCC family thiol-disulfide oxidoreductase YuxK